MICIGTTSGESPDGANLPKIQGFKFTDAFSWDVFSGYSIKQNFIKINIKKGSREAPTGIFIVYLLDIPIISYIFSNISYRINDFLYNFHIIFYGLPFKKINSI